MEAGVSDGPRLASFLLETPLHAGTGFILDRAPDFHALLRLRGRSRTFCALDHGRLVGIATALWDDRRDGDATVRVGEFVDLRVAPSARGGRAAKRLLAKVLGALDEAGVQWLCAVIGDENTAARTLVDGKAGLPRLSPLTRYVSVHMVAARTLLRTRGGRGLRGDDGSAIAIREASGDDAEVIREALGRIHDSRRLSPSPLTWPDPATRHRGWLALDAHGAVVAGLLVWDGHDVRRIRVVRYKGRDRLLWGLTRVLGLAGVAAPLPAPGHALRIWGSRAFWNDCGGAKVTRALVATALHAAAAQGVNLLQLNFPEDDPLLRQLPRYPRSLFWSTLFGAPRDGTRPDDRAGSCFFADLALI